MGIRFMKKDEQNVDVAKQFGIDPERLSWRPTSRPIFAGGYHFTGIFVPGPDAAVIEGLTWTEHRQIKERVRGTEFWCIPISDPEYPCKR